MFRVHRVSDSEPFTGLRGFWRARAFGGVGWPEIPATPLHSTPRGLICPGCSVAYVFCFLGSWVPTISGGY